MTLAEQQALLIHYPSGGFGHFLYGVIATCTDGVFCRPESEIEFSPAGDSHALSLGVTKWIGYSPDFEFIIKDWAKNVAGTHILLVDSYINQDDFSILRSRFPTNRVIRLCIDHRAVPIVHQTCEQKAEKGTKVDVYAETHWESRELVSLRYHYADQHPDDFYLRNFKPVIDGNTINIPISWFAYHFDQLLDTVENFIEVKFNREKTTQVYCEFIQANKKYFMGPIWADRVLDSLRTGSNIDLSECTSFYDQGYVNYCLEREFNLREIPPYTYKDWFKDTNHIRQMLGVIV